MMQSFKVDKNKEVTVIVTGADHPTGLGIARSLKVAKCRIVGFCKNRKSWCCQSNCWDNLITYDSLDNLLGLLIKFGKVNPGIKILFPGQDDVVKLISENRTALQFYFQFRLPDPKIVDLLLDKTQFHNWAMNKGFRVPLSIVCQNKVEMDKAVHRIGFPLIIKPFVKTEDWDIVSPSDKILKIYSPKDLSHLKFDLFSVAEKILVQQWVPGGDDSIYFCLVYYGKDHNRLAFYTGQKIFQAPPFCGSTAAAIGIVNPEIENITRSLFDAVGYIGIGSLELKKSTKDGKYYLIEPTVGRNDLQSNVALVGGVNLPYISFSEIIDDKNIPIPNYRKGVWIEENGMLDSVRFYINRREKILPRIKVLWGFNICFALFSVGDFKPFFSFFVFKFKRLFRLYVIKRFR